MSEDKMEVEETATDSSDEIRKKRIQFLKTVLNVYRARALALTSTCESRMANVIIPEHMKNYEFLREQVRGLHNDVTLLRSFQDSVSIIHNSFTCLGVNNLSNPNLKRELWKAVSEVSFFSQSIIKIYEENVNEIENIKQKQNYIAALSKYQKNLNALKEEQKQSTQTVEDLKRLQKAEIQVNKINFIREMKLILIGKFAGDREKYPALQEFRSPFRKNLTVDDFYDTWDVGLQK